MGSDCKDQLIEDLKKSDFALQLDESTDIANQAQLLVYVRYLNSKNEISEEMLFSHEMEGRTTGECIFNVINSFFYENGLQWEKCCSICTDGAASMTGRYSGFLAHAKDKNAKICATHCIIHREHLAAKTLSEELHSVLNDVVKIVNFIKGRALNARLFRLLCQEMGADHEHLLYHSGVRWLSRGKVLSRVFELLSEVTAFLESAEHELVGVIKKRSWKIYLAYLADIYGKINELNLSLQGRQKTMIETVSSVRAFQEKIKLWMSKFTNGHFYIFPTLNSVIDNDDIRRGLTKVEKCCIINHLEKLGSSFSAYFKYDDINYDWIVSPFTSKIESVPDSLQDDVIDLKNDLTLKPVFESSKYLDFWLKMVSDPKFKKLALEVIKILLPFPTTYLCEVGFSTLLLLKNKQRNKLDVRSDLRLALTQSIAPRIDTIMIKKQSQLQVGN